MSTTIDFYVLTVPSGITCADASVAQRLHHVGCFREFVAQFFDLAQYGFSGYEKPTIQTHQVPLGFSLNVALGDNPELIEIDPLTHGGHRLRYSRAGEVSKAALPEECGHLDRAMMAFLRELDPDTVIVLVIG